MRWTFYKHTPGFSDRKRRAIERLELGSNAKIHLQFESPYWFGKRYSGTAHANDAGEILGT